MRITCPSCAAEYSVPGPLAAGRIVRCARCGSEWAPVPLPSPIAEPPPLPEPVPQPVPQPVPEPIRPAPEPPAPLAPVRPAMPSNKAPLLLAWTGSLVLIAALVAAAFVWRDPIMERWPPSIRVYAAMGLTARP